MAAGFGIKYRVYPFWRDSPRLFGCWGVFLVANLALSRWKNGVIASCLVLLGVPMVLWISSVVWKIVCVACQPCSLPGSALWTMTVLVAWLCRAKLRTMLNHLRWRMNRHRFQGDFQAAAALDLFGGQTPSFLEHPSEDPALTAAKLDSLLTARFRPSLSPSDFFLDEHTTSPSPVLDPVLLAKKCKDLRRQVAHVHGKRIPNQAVRLTVERSQLVKQSLAALRRFPVSDLAQNRCSLSRDRLWS